MQKFYKYISYTILPIIILLVISVLYKKIICYFASSSSDADFICDFKWKDGFILICSYIVVKLLSPSLEFNTVLKRVLITLGLYCFAYAILALPFWIASFFQPFLINVFIHAISAIIIIEIISARFWDKVEV